MERHVDEIAGTIAFFFSSLVFSSLVASDGAPIDSSEEAPTRLPRNVAPPEAAIEESLTQIAIRLECRRSLSALSQL